MVDSEAIQRLSESIAREFRPSSIILFGSYAYGAPTDDSDVDLLVILPFSGKPIHKALEIITKVKPSIPLDLLVRTPEQVEERIANNEGCDAFRLTDLVGLRGRLQVSG
jgi:predicted nucleotidyltransferase